MERRKIQEKFWEKDQEGRKGVSERKKKRIRTRRGGIQKPWKGRYRASLNIEDQGGVEMGRRGKKRSESKRRGGRFAEGGRRGNKRKGVKKAGERD